MLLIHLHIFYMLSKVNKKCLKFHKKQVERDLFCENEAYVVKEIKTVLKSCRCSACADSFSAI